MPFGDQIVNHISGSVHEDGIRRLVSPNGCLVAGDGVFDLSQDVGGQVHVLGKTLKGSKIGVAVIQGVVHVVNGLDIRQDKFRRLHLVGVGSLVAAAISGRLVMSPGARNVLAARRLAATSLPIHLDLNAFLSRAAPLGVQPVTLEESPRSHWRP